MKNWILHPLHVGTIQRDKSIFTYLRNVGTTIDAPVLAWHLECNGHHILVDTGGHDPAEGELHPPYSRTADQNIIAQLAARGVAPEDIEILILTHLHWDHAANCHLFPRAQVMGLGTGRCLKMPIAAKCQVMCKLDSCQQHKCRRHAGKIAQDGGGRRVWFARRPPESWVG